MKLDWQNITEEHGPLVWQAVFRILQSHAESLDCYQDVMVEAYELAQEKAIRNWPGFLRWLAVRRAIDRLRRNSRTQSRIDKAHDVRTVAGPEIGSADLELDDLLIRIRSELTNLPAQQAEAFWLRFVEQLSYADIAQELDINANSVGVLIHRARERVCKALADLRPQSTELISETENE